MSSCDQSTQFLYWEKCCITDCRSSLVSNPHNGDDTP